MDAYIIEAQFKRIKDIFEQALDNGLYNMYFAFFSEDKEYPYTLARLLYIPGEVINFIGVQSQDKIFLFDLA